MELLSTLVDRMQNIFSENEFFKYLNQILKENLYTCKLKFNMTQVNSRTFTIHFISSFTLILLFSNSGFSQFYVPNGYVNQARPTVYGEDTIFIFHSDNSNKLVNITHSTQDTSNFTWSRFNKETETYDSLFTHDSITFSSIRLDSLYQKGFLTKAMEALQVEVINDEDSLELYRCWVVLDTFPDFGEIRIHSNTCQKLWLEVDNFQLENYIYYKLSDSSYFALSLDNDMAVSWTASEDVDIYLSDGLPSYGDVRVGRIGSVSGVPGNSNYIGPFKESDYTLEVTNSFGNKQSGTIQDVEPIAVKSDFDVKKYDDEGNPGDYSESEINEALLQIGLENNSKNEDHYHWIGYNDSLKNLRGGDSILWENQQKVPDLDSIPKYLPGKYAVKLIVSNDFGCVDSMSFFHVKVDSSQIDSALIPNVFTPNGDGSNDVFVLQKKSNLSGEGKSRGLISMKRIEVTVLNRGGELVYQYDGKPDNWEGWNGKVRNGNRDAAEGIYLYVIKGKGWDGVWHESENFTGFLYLFR